MGSDWERELKRVKNRLPSPIAHAIYEMISSRDALARYQRLLESIELTARFLALLGAAEILKSGRQEFDKFELLKRGSMGATVEFLQFCSRQEEKTHFGELLSAKQELLQVRELVGGRKRRHVSCLTFFDLCAELRNVDRGHGLPSEQDAGNKFATIGKAYLEVLGHIGIETSLSVRFIEEIRVLSHTEREVRSIELHGTDLPFPDTDQIPLRSLLLPDRVFVEWEDEILDLHPWMVWRNGHLFFLDAIKKGVPEYKTHSKGTKKEEITELAQPLLDLAPSLFSPKFWSNTSNEGKPTLMADVPLQEEPNTSSPPGIAGTTLESVHEEHLHSELWTGIEFSWEDSEATETVELSNGEQNTAHFDAVVDSSSIEESRVVILNDPPEVSVFAKMSKPVQLAYVLRFVLESYPQVVPLELLLRQQTIHDLAKATWEHLAEQHHDACAPHFIQGPRHHIFPPKPSWFPTTVDEGALLANLRCDLGSNGSHWSDLLETLENFGPLYRTHRVQKSSGGVRTLHEPIGPLKRAQTRIAKALLATHSFHDNAMAYVPQRSHVHHALQHANATNALKVDIKDFFDSITSRHVLRALSRWTFTIPNGLKSPHWDGSKFQFFEARPVRVPNPFANFSREGKLAILKLCLRNDRLPQGAPSSPALANLVAHTLDCKLASLRLKGLTYTRYADDIVISQATSLVHWEPADALAHVEHALNHEGWKLNDSKTVFWTAEEGTPLTICGIRVPGPQQKFPDLSRDLKRKVRAALHATEKARDLDESRGMLAYAYFATGNFAYRMASSSDTARLVENLGRHLGYKDDALREFVGVWKSVRRPEAPHLGLPKS